MYLAIQLKSDYDMKEVISIEEYVNSEEDSYALVKRVLDAEKALRKPHKTCTDDNPF